MSVFDNLVEVRRKLLRAEIDLDGLPPFAITPAEFWSLATRREFSQENTQYVGKGVFTVRGLRCMKAD